MEKHFKNKLKQHHVAWDKEALWEELVPQLPEKQSKRKRWFFLLLLLLIIPFCWRTEEVALSTETEVTAEHILQDSDSEYPIAANQPTIEESAVATSPDPSPLVAFNPQQEIVVFSEEEVTSISIPQVKSSKATKVTLEKPSGETKINLEKNTEFSFASAAEEATSVERNNETTALLTPRSYSLLPTLLEQLPSSVVPAKNEIGSSQKGRFFAATFLGVGTVERNDTYLTEDSELATAQQRNQALVAPRFVATTQVELGYQLSSHWSVALGLGHQQIYEQFNFNGITRSDTITEDFDKARFFVKSSGDTLFFAGPSDALEQVSRKIRHNNRLQSTYIPLQVFYTQDYRRFQWSTGIGINWTATSKYKGRINDTNIGITDDPNYQLQHRWGYSLSFGTRFQLTEKKHLFARFAYQKSPTWEYEEVRQSYASYGLQLGARMMLD